MAILNNLRNFSIIAHIDHGKSTLADRLIHFCGGLTDREMKEQVLDSMELERERGITIKAQTVRLNYKSEDGKEYILNLMDTPGHVDFAYEVSRSLAACEGSILIVDSTQGVEAQTLANAYQAINNDHEIVPVLNKVDLPSSEPQKIKDQIEEILGIDAKNAALVSAKTGQGIKEAAAAKVKARKTTEPNIGHIYLNMPQAIAYDDSISWDAKPLGMVGAVMDSGFTAAGKGGAIGNAGNIASAGIGAMLGGLVGKLGIAGVGIGAILGGMS